MKRLNWLHVPLLFTTPLIALYGMATTPWMWQTVLWSVVYYFCTGLGITAGYHRLWAHRAYKATPLVSWLLMLCGTGAVEGSIRWWCRDHRAHHRYVDTRRDPYAVTNGFFYAHMGWMLVRQDKTKIGRADIHDLNEQAMIRFQHRQYLPLAIIMGFVFPCLVAGLGWGDYRGGFFLAGVARLVFVHHSTFFVNSLAHYWGDQTYTDGHTAKNSVITALLTLGEGYHNFHHEFPSDYRNGIRWYHYDPTKWLIRGLELLGLTYTLQRFPENEIQKGVMQMRQRRLDADAGKLHWAPADETLKPYTRQQVKDAVATGAQLIIIDGYVLDVHHFREEHPGGTLIIANNLGEDVTEAFGGKTYRHSNAAHNLQQTMRVGKIVGA